MLRVISLIERGSAYEIVDYILNMLNIMFIIFSLLTTKIANQMEKKFPFRIVELVLSNSNPILFDPLILLSTVK